jgi:hypothetical protein
MKINGIKHAFMAQFKTLNNSDPNYRDASNLGCGLRETTRIFFDFSFFPSSASSLAPVWKEFFFPDKNQLKSRSFG